MPTTSALLNQGLPAAHLRLTDVEHPAPSPADPRALVIEGDRATQDEVLERLAALGHQGTCAASIEEARHALAQGGIDYVVLSLEMPFAGGGPARVEYGLAFLSEVNQQQEDLPVVVMTAHGHDSSDLAAAVINAGKPVDFIRKPFPGPGQQGRTLEEAVKKAVDTRHRQLAGGRLAPTLFSGGVLRFTPDRVELLGVTICTGSGLKRRIFDVLRISMGPDGWQGLTADELADRVGAAGGTSVSSTIKTLRERMMDLLLKRANVTLGEADIILSGHGRGYRFAPGISVETVAADVRPEPHIAVTVYPHLPEGVHWNERQVAIAARLVVGQSVRRKELEAEFRVSDKTIKRDLATMKTQGLAVPQGSGNDHLWLAGPTLRQAGESRDRP